LIVVLKFFFQVRPQQLPLVPRNSSRTGNAMVALQFAKQPFDHTWVSGSIARLCVETTWCLAPQGRKRALWPRSLGLVNSIP
jgi:hypothetical protein